MATSSSSGVQYSQNPSSTNNIFGAQSTPDEQQQKAVKLAREVLKDIGAKNGTFDINSDTLTVTFQGNEVAAYSDYMPQQVFGYLLTNLVISFTHRNLIPYTRSKSESEKPKPGVYLTASYTVRGHGTEVPLHKYVSYQAAEETIDQTLQKAKEIQASQIQPQSSLCNRMTLVGVAMGVTALGIYHLFL